MIKVMIDLSMSRGKLDGQTDGRRGIGQALLYMSATELKIAFIFPMSSIKFWQLNLWISCVHIYMTSIIVLDNPMFMERPQFIFAFLKLF